MAANITNIFVLMLENRSFDHMLGFSGISGRNADGGKPTAIDGLSDQTNSYRGLTYKVLPAADDTMPVDPGHEFLDTLEQLCGTNVAYPPAGPYPPINNSGFVADYAISPTHDEGNAPNNFGEIMKCFSPEQLPILNALAREFAVCDNWHSSIPGPTWPNRLFACGASSAGLDHSPTTAEMATWETRQGLEFKNGSIFDALRSKFKSDGWRIFAGASPMAAALKGITVFDTFALDGFPETVAAASYPWRYTWIEPHYGDTAFGTYRGGNSQHPMDGVTPGEALIKTVYEAIRNSPHWESSLLIVTWDEHGGFYDHVPPPAAVPPGDTPVGDKFNQHHFAFDRYGVRVPAVVVSPFIPENTIDHRLYDHSSIPKTIETIFGLPPLTARDAVARDVMPLLSLDAARPGTRTQLPDPAQVAGPRVAVAPPPDESVDRGSLPGFLHVAMKQDLEISPSEAQHAILARVQSIQTRGQAAAYIQEVQSKVQAAKATN